MEVNDKQLLQRAANDVGALARNKFEEERLRRFVELGLVAVVGTDAKHSAPMPALYRITELGRTI